MKTPFRFFRSAPLRRPMGTWVGTFCLLIALALVGLPLTAPLQAQTVSFVRDIRPGSAHSFPRELTAVGNTLYFRANDGTNGDELWKTDGTAAGTVLVKDINPSGDSYPDDLTVVGNTLYFRANDGTHGDELWKSDGTPAGTVLVKDIEPGAGGSSPRYLTAMGSTLYFSADDGTTGNELWKSDGTEAGTVLVKDIFPGTSTDDPNFPFPNSSYPVDLTAVGNTLYFVANDGTNGQELWKSDGTEAGTVLVKVINPSDHSSADQLTAVGNTLFFRTNDGTNGQELWKSDGTEAGTVLVKNINPSDDSSPYDLTAVGNTLFFTADDGTGTGRELWKSDGTEAGTVLVKDIYPGPISAYPGYPSAVGNTLYFQAYEGINGGELWKSDGTEAGTVMGADIYPGSGSSNPGYMTVVGNTPFFWASDDTHGIELWKLVPVCDTRVAALPSTPASACPGQPLPVTFATVGACPDPPAEAFQVQLSNAFGSFANPTTLGYATPGTTNLALPAGLPAGTGYRVRILSGGQTSAASAPFRVAGPSLNLTPTVGGAPACRGSQVTVAFSLPTTSCPFPEGNLFTAQLSSATGSFNNPTTLGTVQPGVASPVTIPASVSAGSGYRIRLVSSSPALTSTASTPFRINACPGRLSADEPRLVVAPNPVSGQEIRLRVVGLDNPAFSLTSAAGRSLGLSAKTDGTGEYVLTPKSSLAAGIYVVQAQEGTLRLTQRVLVVE